MSLTGALHYLPMAISMATGRQIMQGIHPLRDGSAFDAHVAKCGSKASGEYIGIKNTIL